ncbi:hypothetical protein EKD04_006085 [Chloroflexales bacterium ZM16-3]|nr:hypothetical protein [Chloroflexales bacterium ZM16-3]
MRQFRLFLLACGLALLTLFALSHMPRAVAASAPAAFTTPRTTYPIVDTAPITRALTFLASAQSADGGFAGFTPGQSDDFTTIKVALALNAARLPAGYLTSSGGHTAIDYLTTRAYSYTHDLGGLAFPGRVGMLALAVVAGDANPVAFGAYPVGHAMAGQPINLITVLDNTYHPATGAYSSTATLGFSSGVASSISQSYALLGLAAAQQSPPAAAIIFLREIREADGGWGYGFGSDVDATALAIQALIASGVAPTDAAIQDGLAFIRGQQLADGTWGYNGAPSPDSTAIVIQAAAAAGFAPVTASWATADGDPQRGLLALQSEDGSFSGNALGTADAIPGLAEMPLPQLGRSQRAERALAALRDTQGADGAWSPYGSPDVGGTLDAILAFSAAGYDSGTVTASGGGTSALGFLSTAVFTYTRDDSAKIFPAQTGKAILSIVAAGADPAAFGVNPGGGTLNLVADLEGAFDPATGTYTTTAMRGFSSGAASPVSQSFAILGLAAAGRPIPANAVTSLRGFQDADGTWGTSIDTTGLALQALRAAGVSAADPAIVKAIAYLRAQQDALGGWDNPNSTAFAIQGLLAAGEDLANWRKAGRSPYEALALYQKPDGPFTYTWESGGYFTPGAADNFATRQSIPGLLGVAFPLKPQPGDLVSYTPAARGPNPDRLVALAPRGRWGNSITVSLPFGGDLNQNASATLEWRPVGATSWTTATLTRGDGAFSATLNVSDPRDYELRAALSDPDGVQSGATVEATATLTSTVPPLRTYLPMVRR